MKEIFRLEANEPLSKAVKDNYPAQEQLQRIVIAKHYAEREARLYKYLYWTLFIIHMAYIILNK